MSRLIESLKSLLTTEIPNTTDTNIEDVTDRHPVHMPDRPLPRQEPLAAFAQFERDWLYNRAIRFIPTNIVQRSLRARRPAESTELIEKSLAKFEVPRHIIPRDEHYNNAIRWTTENGSPNRKLHPIHYCDLRYYPWNLPPNAEAPWNIPDYRFKPQFRDIDGESESPHLEAKINQNLLYRLRDTITVKEYLRIKQGLGLINSSAPTYHNLFNEIFVRNRFLIHQIKDKRYPFWTTNGSPRPYYWNTVHIKTTVVDENDDDKIRIVFGATKLILHARNMFLWPLQATYLNTGKGFLLWNREIVRGGLRRLTKEVLTVSPEAAIFCADWGEYDKRFLHELQDACDDIQFTYYDLTQYEPTSINPHAPADPVRLTNLWYWTKETTKMTPYLTPSGRLQKWNYSGFGSGYQDTQVKDSFGNAISITCILSALGINIFSPTFLLKIQGDDSFCALLRFIFILYGKTFIPRFKDAAIYYFNMKLKIEVTLFLESIEGATVLSYEIRHGLPFRTKIDLLQHLFFPKSARNWNTLAGSVLGLAYANAGIHEDFHNLCCYIWNKIVHEKGVTPKIPSSDRFMLSMATIADEDTIIPTDLVFPTFLQLAGRVQSYTPRSEKQNQSLWPTEPGPRGNFYFLKSV